MKHRRVKRSRTSVQSLKISGAFTRDIVSLQGLCHFFFLVHNLNFSTKTQCEVSCYDDVS